MNGVANVWAKTFNILKIITAIFITSLHRQCHYIIIIITDPYDYQQHNPHLHHFSSAIYFWGDKLYNYAVYHIMNGEGV